MCHICGYKISNLSHELNILQSICSGEDPIPQRRWLALVSFLNSFNLNR
jgi:hypothetical protein